VIIKAGNALYVKQYNALLDLSCKRGYYLLNLLEFNLIMKTNLGNKLQQVRKLKSFSLRDVEAKTGISNAYLSQLERGDANNPSPKKLKLLADCYDIPYADLLNLAGYLPSDSGNQSQLIASQSDDETNTILGTALKNVELTEEEENSVVQYITFLKSQRK